MIHVISKLKLGKTPGRDEITAEIGKFMRNIGREKFLELLTVKLLWIKTITYINKYENCTSLPNKLRAKHNRTNGELMPVSIFFSVFSTQ